MTIRDRIHQAPWSAIEESLWNFGYASTGPILTADECFELSGSYPQNSLFRKTIDMARFRFGQGEYRYFAYPLPLIVEELRSSLYAALSPVANNWMEALGMDIAYPPSHSEFVEQCHARGQTRPTPLLLRYHAGDFNCLHQDLYGEIFFPFQVIFSLSEPGRDFRGGELMLVEQRPRAQSIGQVILPRQGEGIIITTRLRPVQGQKSRYRANVRHGVSRVASGERYTLGIIFHDAN